jgi:hypothetical protein
MQEALEDHNHIDEHNHAQDEQRRAVVDEQVGPSLRANQLRWCAEPSN